MKAFTHYFHKSFWFLYGVSTIYMEDRRQFGLHVPCHVSCSPSNYRLFMARVRFRNNEEKASSSSLWGHNVHSLSVECTHTVQRHSQSLIFSSYYYKWITFIVPIIIIIVIGWSDFLLLLKSLKVWNHFPFHNSWVRNSSLPSGFNHRPSYGINDKSTSMSSGVTKLFVGTIVFKYYFKGTKEPLELNSKMEFPFVSHSEPQVSINTI